MGLVIVKIQPLNFIFETVFADNLPPKALVDIWEGDIPVNIKVKGNFLNELYRNNDDLGTYRKTAAISLSVMSHVSPTQTNQLLRGVTTGIIKIKK